MPSIGSITKTIRVNKEDREQIEGLMKKEGISFSRAVHELIKGTPQVKEKSSSENIEGTPQDRPRIDRSVVRSIREMSKASGIEEADFYRSVCEMWEAGTIYVEYGQIYSKGRWKMEEFEAACSRVNMFPQKVIDKIAKGLR